MSTATTLRPTPVHSSNNLRQATLKKNMSVTQTYYLAHKARGKLSREAAQPDHDLRLLVGHANLLDSLMVELADAEREQERWFNQSVRGAEKKKPAAATEQRHIQWADRIVEQPEEEDDEDDFVSDSDSSDSDEDYDEDIAMHTAASGLRPAAATSLTEEDDDLEEDYAQLELVRTPSHSNSPPELVDHDSDDSEDESMPPSPTDATLEISEKEVLEQSDEEEPDHTSYYGKDYYLPSRSPARLVTAITVY